MGTSQGRVPRWQQRNLTLVYGQSNVLMLYISRLLDTSCRLVANMLGVCSPVQFHLLIGDKPDYKHASDLSKNTKY